MGSGPIQRRGADRRSTSGCATTSRSCFCDMTRTFVFGDIPRRDPRMARVSASRRSTGRSRRSQTGRTAAPSSTARARSSSAAGQPTQRTKEPGTILGGRVLPRARPRRRPRCARAVREWASSSKLPLKGGRRRHGRAGLLPAGLRRRAARGSGARDEGRRREPHGLPVRPGTVTTAKDIDNPVPRGAALPAAARVRGAGERSARDLRRGVRRVLGARRTRAGRMVRTVHEAVRVGAAVRQVVPRRQAQRGLETASTSTSKQGAATRSPITGKASPMATAGS